MKDRITEILNGDVYPSVYVLEVALTVKELAKLKQDKGTKLFAIDGTQIVDSMSLFQQFAIVMQLPEYFGNNWDALKDCLTELDGDEVDRYIITIDKLDNFIDNDPSQWANFLDVCKSAIEYWQETETPLYVLLHGNSAPI